MSSMDNPSNKHMPNKMPIMGITVLLEELQNVVQILSTICALEVMLGIPNPSPWKGVSSRLGWDFDGDGSKYLAEEMVSAGMEPRLMDECTMSKRMLVVVQKVDDVVYDFLWEAIVFECHSF